MNSNVLFADISQRQVTFVHLAFLRILCSGTTMAGRVQIAVGAAERHFKAFADYLMELIP
jgi:hypothetical protein